MVIEIKTESDQINQFQKRIEIKMIVERNKKAESKNKKIRKRRNHQ